MTDRINKNAALGIVAALAMAPVTPAATGLLVTVSTAAMTQPAQAFDVRKAGRAFGRDLNNARRKAIQQVSPKGGQNHGRNIAIGVGAGLLVGIATDSVAAGIVTGVAVAAAPVIFKQDLYDSYGREMEWSGNVNSRQQRIVVSPGRSVSDEERQAVNAQIKQDHKDVQTALKQLGLYSLKIDGDFGPGSRAGVKEFQRSLGNPETGVLTAEERHRLFIRAREDGYVRVAALGTPNSAISGVFEPEPVPKAIVAPIVIAIPEYRLAKSRFDALNEDYLMAGTISAVTAARLEPDGSIVLDVEDASGNTQTLTGPVGGIYAEPHPLADEWVRVYYRAQDGSDPVTLNTRDHFQSAQDAQVWTTELNDSVILLRRLTGETVEEPETQVASIPAGPDASAPNATMTDTNIPITGVPQTAEADTPQADTDLQDGDTVIKAGPDGTIQIPAEPDPPLDNSAQETDAGGQETRVASLKGFESEPETCRQSVYISWQFPEGHDTISHYNITPPDGAIMFDNGDSTAYFTGSCVQGEYAFSYVHIEKGDEEKDWKHHKHEGHFVLASNAEQCSVNLNSPAGSAELECF